MVKKIFATLLLATLATYTVGCSSSSSESETAKNEDTSASDLDALDEGAASEQAATEGSSQEGATTNDPDSDILADLGDDSGELKKDEAIAPAPTEGAPAEALTESSNVATTEPAPTDTAAPAEGDLFGGGAATAPTEEAPKPIVSLKKIKTAPYTEKGILANTVYIARKGDDLAGVSQKTGSDKKDLKKLNSFLSRGVKVGDKIYYNSKARPTDSERMLTYWEDAGVPAQTYTAKSGDNIKKLGKDLLGHKDSWKELWATNPVESKDALNEGEMLRYWPSDAVAPTQTVAANELPPIQEPAAIEPPPPPPPTEPVPQQAAATATVEPPPPPPPTEPPPIEMAKPPKLAKKDKGGGLTIPGLGQDETFAIGGAVLLALLGGSVIMIRRSRARKLSSSTQTQI